MKSLNHQHGFSLTELVVGLSILATVSLIISTILFTGFSFSEKNSSDIYIGTELKKGFEFLKEDLKNSSYYSILSEGKGLMITLYNGENVTYMYDSNSHILKRNDNPVMNYVKDIQFFLKDNELLGIDITYQQKEVEYTVPSTLYISTKK